MPPCAPPRWLPRCAAPWRVGRLRRCTSAAAEQHRGGRRARAVRPPTAAAPGLRAHTTLSAANVTANVTAERPHDTAPPTRSMRTMRTRCPRRRRAAAVSAGARGGDLEIAFSSKEKSIADVAGGGAAAAEKVAAEIATAAAAAECGGREGAEAKAGGGPRAAEHRRRRPGRRPGRPRRERRRQAEQREGGEEAMRRRWRSVLQRSDWRRRRAAQEAAKGVVRCLQQLPIEALLGAVGEGHPTYNWSRRSRGRREHARSADAARGAAHQAAAAGHQRQRGPLEVYAHRAVADGYVAAVTDRSSLGTSRTRRRRCSTRHSSATRPSAPTRSSSPSGCRACRTTTASGSPS